MSSVITTILAAALVNNLVFVQLVGVSSLFAFTRRFEAASEWAILSFLIMFPALLACALTERLVLSQFGLEFLSLLIFVTISVSCSHVMLHVLQKHFPLLTRRHQLAVLLLSSNSAIIGAALLNSQSQLSIPLLVASCFGAALGFSLLLITFAALRQRVELADLPQPMQGAAIDLLSAGIVAMCLLGFAGLV